MFWRQQRTRRQRWLHGDAADRGQAMTLRALEPRVLLDAAALATAANETQDTQQQQNEPPPQPPTDPQATELAHALAQLDTAAAAPSPPQDTSVYFIDTAVAQPQPLIDALGPGAEVHVLRADSDGVQQIADILQGRSGISSVHILSHGDEGTLRLGNATLDAASLQSTYQDELQTIGSALTAEGDILIYGCDFGRGAAGEQALQFIASFSGAEVATTTDATGAARFGGDWELEAATGAIEAATLAADGWGHLLATGTPVVTVWTGDATADGVSSGSFTHVDTVGVSRTVSVGLSSFNGSNNGGTSFGVNWSTAAGTNGAATGATNASAANNGVAVDSGQEAGATTAALTLSHASGSPVSVTNPVILLSFLDAGNTITFLDAVTITVLDQNGVGAVVTGNNVTFGSGDNTAAASAAIQLSGTFTGQIRFITSRNGTTVNDSYAMGLMVSQLDVPPVIDLNGAGAGTDNTVAYTENAAAVALAPAGTVANTASALLSMRVVITNGQAGDVLSTTALPGGITASYDAGTFTLTLSGSATPANYATALQALRYSSASEDPSVTPRVVNITTNDGSLDSNVATATINVTAVEDTPVVDLNSGVTPTQIVSNGTFATGTGGSPTGWAGTGGGAVNSGGAPSAGYVWTTGAVSTGHAGTLTQSAVTGWDSGAAPSGAAVLSFEFAWANRAGVPTTMEVSVGGVVYVRITGATDDAATSTTNVEYLNGATGNPATLPHSPIGTWVMTAVTVNLPVNVPRAADLVFNHIVPTATLDAMRIDNVSVLTTDLAIAPDATAGVNFSTSYTENGPAVSIANTDSSVRDIDDALMQSATIVLTNAQAGDALTPGALPGGISANVDTSVPGQITITLTGAASRADYNAAIRGITFSSLSDAPPTVARTVNVTVNDGAATSAVATTTIAVTAVNDAPVLADTALVITQAEDAAAPSGAVGTLVSALVGGVTDVDAGALNGIAITAADTTNGTWFFSTNNGATWTAMGAVSEASARLLATGSGATAARVYFQPTTNFNGSVTAGLTMRAWDTTSGTNGGLGNASVNGGTTAFSSATDVVAVTVTPVNDAPVLADTVLTLTVNEDSPAPVGAVGSLLSAFTGGISDVDAGAVKGVAISAIVETNGTWHYSTDGGATWSLVGPVNATSALLLADNPQTRLYFQPAANFSTSVAGALTLRAWDQTAGGTAGIKVNPTPTGGTAPFSTATDTIAVTVNAVNDAPVLDPATDRFVNNINEDTLTQSTTTTWVPTFIGTVSDIDAGAVQGVAIIAADSTNGTWYYTLNDGTSWTAFGAVSENNALLLANQTNTRVAFIPNPDYNGNTPAALTIRAWDQTIGTNGGRGDASINGGTTAFSTATDAVRMAVLAIGDIVNDTVNTTEDATATFSPITGVGEANGADNFENSNRQITAIAGVAITPGGAAVAVTNGSVTLEADGITLTFTPAADFNGSINFTYAVTSGGGAPETATIFMNIAAVADAPRIDLDTTTAGSGYAASYDQGLATIGNSISVTDPENNNLTSMTITLAGATATDSLSLAGTLPVGITGSYNPATGVYTLTGNSTLANYQTALGLIRLNTTSGTPVARTISVSAVSDTAPTASNVATATFTLLDSDGDGTSNNLDIDDDNDGIVDFAESNTTGFDYADLPTASGVTSVSSTVAGVPVTITANQTFNVAQRTEFAPYPDNLQIPNQLGGVSTVAVVRYTVTFASPVRDPVVAFQSLGQAGLGVPILFSRNIELIYAVNTVLNSPTQITGNEGNCVVRVLGEVTSFTFDFLVAETQTLFTLGATHVGAINTDADSIANRLDIDSDNDGITDNVEAQPTAGYIPPSGQGAAMTDADNDGLDDVYDASTADTTATASVGLAPVDTDTDATPDYLDSDSDNDGAPDIAERGDGQPTSITSTTDSDGDGLLDIFEGSNVSDGFDVNDENLIGTTFNLADSDEDTAADGANATPRTTDLDYRDNAATPVVDLNSAASVSDADRNNAVAYAGGSPAVAVAAPGAGTNDLGENDLSSLSISVSGLLDGASEILNIGGADFVLNANATQTVSVGGTNFSVAYTVAAGFVISNAAGGVMPPAALDTLLRGIAYRNANVHASAGDRRLTFVLTDTSTARSTAAVATVSVSTGNTPPTANDDSVTATEDTVASGNVLTNDSDADGDTLTVTGFSIAGDATVYAPGDNATIAGVGSLTINADGSFTFTPVADYNGAVPLVSYTLADGFGGSAGANLTIGPVAPVNDAPVGVNDSYTMPEDTTLTIDLLANDTDVDGDALHFFTIQGEGVTGGAQSIQVADGVVNIDANGVMTFTPTADFNGSTNFFYTVSDPGDLRDNAIVFITVTPVNDAPVAVDDSYTTAEDTAVTLDLLANDSDVDLDVLQLASINGVPVTGGVQAIAVPDGTVNIDAGGVITFIPAINFNGPVTFDYEVFDGTVTDTGTVSIDVTPVADAPVAVDDAYTTNEDTAVTLDLLANDTDVDTPTLSIASINGTALTGGAQSIPVPNGTVNVDAGGGVTFAPAADFNGPVSFDYVVSDGGLTDTGTVTINVTAINDAPVNTVPGAQAVDEDAVLAFTGPATISVNDVDGNLATTQLSVNSGTLTVNLAGGATISAGANGSNTLTLSGTQVQINAALATLTYQGNLNFNGGEVLTVLSTDSDGVPLSDTDTVAITVNSINDAPVNTVPAAQTVDEDTALAFTGAATISVNDVDGNLASTQLSVSNGTLTVDLAGGATISAGANGSTTLTLSGTQAQINAALATLSYQGNLDFNGSDVLTMLSTDSAGVPLSDTDTVAITVTPVNDAPVNTVPGPQTVDEDAALPFTGPATISVNDVDGNLATTQLSVNSGTLTVDLAGGATISAGANGSGTLTLSGTQIQINAALATLSYQGNLNFNGSDVLTVLSTDSDGVPLSDTDTVTITVTSVNDAPVNTVPGPQAVNEDTALPFTGPATISVNDVDANLATTQLSVNSGTLTVDLAGGATVSAGVNGSSTLTLSGTQVQINAALATLVYQGNLDFNGSDVLTVLSTDSDGVPLSDTDTVAITVNSINDAPVNTVPGPQTVDEDTALPFTGPATISVVDVDDNLATTQLSVNSGTLTVDLAGGATISAGVNGSSTLTLSGTQVQINAALATLVYQGNLNFNGSDVLTVLSTDSDGVPLSDTDTVDITVTSINDAPVNTVPGPQAVDEDTALPFTGPATISVNDVDGNLATTQLSVNSGTLTVDLAGGATVTAGANGSSSLTLSGTQVQINAALATLVYQGNLDFNGSDVLTVLSTDSDGVPLSDTDTVAITVNAINDAPVNTVPGAQTVNEDTALQFTGPATISVNDVDANLATTQLSVNSGTLTVDLAGGATASAGANGSSTLTLSGTQVQINAALATLNYQGNLNFNGSDVLTVLSTDSDGVPLSDTDTVAITVTSINDAPVNTVPGPQTVNEDTALPFTGPATISVNDVDGNLATTQLSVSNGTLTVQLTGGATVSAGANGSSTLTLSGTQAQINAALATLVYQGNLDFNGSDVLTVLSTDSDGVPLSDTDTVAITVTSINDAPVNTVPGPQTVNEDTALPFTGPATISVSDVDGNLATTQLSVNSGTLTVDLAGGATVSAGANGTSTLTLSGTQVQINAALATLNYQGNLDFNGSDVLTVLSTDSDGVPLSDTDTVAITVTSVNDAPVNTVPGAQTVNEDTALPFTGPATISVSDVDANLATTQLSANSGTLTVNLAGGATISAGANGSNTLTLSGTQVQINAALATLIYQGNLNFNDGDVLTVLSTDSDGVPLSDTDTVDITVNSINDAPVNTVPGPQTVDEDTALPFTGPATISVNDVDGNLATTQLSVGNGTLTVDLAGGATVSAGANGSSTLTLSGTQTQISAALATLTYQGNPDFNGSDVLTVLSTDSDGVPLSDTDTVTITVTSVNDAPVNTVPGPQAVNEDTALPFTGPATISVNDVDANLATTQLSVNSGTLTVDLAGGATVSAGVNGSSTLTLSGTQVQINAALATLVYQGNLDFNGSDVLTVLSTDSDGVPLSDTDTVAITVNSINDAPVNTVPGPQTVDEDTALPFTGPATISVVDVDDNLATTQLSVNSGTLTVDLAGGATISAGVNGSSTLTLSGTQVQINAALATLVYQGNLNFNGSDVLTVLSTDSDGVPLSDTDTVDITVTSINDAPVNTVPGPQAVDEDTALPFTGPATISVNDVDGNLATTQLSVNSGTLTVDLAGGATVTAGANGSSSLTLSGTQVQINAALATLVYQGNLDFNGSDVLTVLSTDSDGVPLSDTDTVAITVNAINDAPVNTVPGAQTVNEDTALQFTGPATISVNDVDANLATTQLSVNSGTLTVDLAGGATASAGANGSSTLTLSGTQVQINAALATLNYQGNLNFNGSDVLTVLSTDSDGVPLSDTDTVAITVTSINDAPVNTVPGPQTVNEDTALPFTGPATISVNDVDGNLATTQLSVSNGTLTVQLTGGATVSAGANGSSTLTLSGTQAQINAALATLVYQGNLDFNGSDVLTVLSTDSDGVPLSDTDTVAITVTSINDAPVNTVPGPQTVNEDTALPFTGPATISVSDVDGNLATTQLSVNSGTLTVDLAGGATISAGANGSNTLTLSGTQVQINAALASLVYQGSQNFNGSDVLTVLSTDSDGVPLSDTDTVAITVNSINDAPVNTVPGAQTVNEDTALAFTGPATISVNDVDGNLATTQLSVSNGTLTVGLVGGATISAGANGSSTLTLSGTEAQINAALATLAYQGNLNFNGSDVLTVLSTDSDGVPLSDTDTVAITAISINDAPVNTVPGPQTVSEDTALPFTGPTTISVNDVDGNLATTQLSVNSGTLAVQLTGGATISAGASGSNTLTLSGTQTQINAALATLVYQGNLNFNGSDVLTVLSTDSEGVPLSDTDTVAITVNSINDAPVNTVPGPQTVNEDTALPFTGPATISVNDVDGNLATTQISVNNGTLTVQLTGGATISAGANESNTLTLSGTQVQINAALASLVYQGNLNFNGSDVLTVLSTDSDGVPLSDTDTVTITVNSINDAPVNTVPGPQTVNEDTALPFAGPTTISVNDVDANLATTQLSVNNGTLTVQLTAGATISAGANGSNTLTLSGTQAQINAALATLSYQGNLNFNGSDVLTVLSTDSDGIPLSDTDTVAITVNAVNDTPVAVDDAYTTAEDTPLTLDLLANDTDAEGDTLSIASINSVALTPGTAQAIVVTNGTVNVSDTGVVSFTPAPDFNGTLGFGYVVADGQGGTAPATVAITVTPVNDAPVNTLPASYATPEDQVLTLSGISLADVDAGAGTLTVTLSVDSGSLGATSGAGVTVGGSGTPSLSLSGTLADLNAYLASGATPVYVPAADYNGAATLTMTTSDGALSDSDTSALGITPVADIAADNLTTAEDTPITFNVLDGSGGASADSFEDPARFVSAVTQPPAGQGNISFAADGTITYTPALNFNGTTSFSYTVNSGGVTESATVTITVGSVADDIVISALDDGSLAGTDGAVLESALPAGSAPGAGSSVAGSFNMGPAENLVSFTVGASGPFTLAQLQGSAGTPLVIAGSFGTLNINGYDSASGLVSYSYTLGSAANHGGGNVLESFALGVTDTDGDTTANAATLAIEIVDDGPVARADMDDAINLAGQPSSTADGNVLTGSGGIDPGSADGIVDDPGADSGLHVSAVVAGTGTPLAGNVGIALAGSFGSLTLAADGSYSYTPDLGNPAVSALAPGESLSDTFTYQITDADGSVATATLTVNIYGTPAVVSTSGALVFESNLTAGTTPADTREVYEGSLVLTAGPEFPVTTFTIGGVTFTAAELGAFSSASPSAPIPTAHGELVLTGLTSDGNGGGTVGYRFTLTGAADHSGGPVSDSLAMSVTDSAGNDTATRPAQLLIQIEDDAPLATADGAAITEDAAPASVGGQVLVNDSLGADVSAAPVTGVQPGGSAAAGNVGTPIAGSYGTLTLNADGSYSYLLDNANATVNALQTGQTLSDIFTYQVTDADGDSTSAQLSIVISGANDAPLAQDDSAATLEDQSVSLNLLANDSDPEGDTLRVSAIDATALTPGVAQDVAVAGGTVHVDANGAISFTPAANFSGNATFGYTIEDGQGGSAGANVVIVVTEVNDPPVAQDDSLSTPEDQALTLDLIANDSDIDADTLGVSAVNGVALTPGTAQSIAVPNGTVIVSAAGAISFTPALNYNGPVSFSYTVADGRGGSDAGLVSINVTPVNDAPVAQDDSVTTNEDTPVALDLLGNDGDVDGDALQVQSINGTLLTPGTAQVIAVPNGTVSVSAAGTISFTPALNYNGPVSFDYVVSDGSLVDIATVAINVTAVNNAPVNTVPAAQTVDEDSPLAFTGGALVSVNDVDGNLASTQLSVSNGVLTVQLTGGASISAGANGSGTLTLSGTQAQINAALATLTYQGNANFNGNDVLTVLSTDSAGAPLSDSDTVAISVNAINDAPVAANDSYTTVEDTPVALNLLANDSDVDGDALHIVSIEGVALTGGAQLIAVANGTVSIDTAGAISFIPATSFNGTSGFGYVAADPSGASATATVTITITEQNDPPVAANDDYSTPEDTALALNLLANDSDIDRASLRIVSINGVAVTGGAQSFPMNGGSVEIDAAGAMRFVPTANFHGPVSFDYVIADSFNATDSATVRINVTPVNDPPVALDDTAPQVPPGGTVSGQLLNNDGDIDGDTLSVSQIALDANGDGVVESFAVPPGGQVSVPIVNATGTPVGTLLAGADGSYNFSAQPGYAGPLPLVQITVSDGQATDTSVLSLGDVANLPPAVVNDDAQTQADGSSSGNVLTNDSDPNNDPLSVTQIAVDTNGDGQPESYGVPPSGSLSLSLSGSNGQPIGQLTMGADGSYRFVPDPSYQGPVPPVTVTVSDGIAGGNSTLRFADVTASDVPAPLPLPPLDPGLSTDNSPAAPAPSDAGAQDGLTVSGVVLDAINDAGGLSGTLALDGSGVVLQAVNGAQPLMGVEQRGNAAVNGARWASFWNPLRGIDGQAGADIVSSLGSAQSPDGATTLQLLADRERVWLDVNDLRNEARQRIIRTQVAMPNGGALPPWVRTDGLGRVFIDRPAGVERLALRIVVQRADGSNGSYVVEIDLNNVQLRVSNGDQRTAVLPPAQIELPLDFITQLQRNASRAPGSRSQVDFELMEALR